MRYLFFLFYFLLPLAAEEAPKGFDMQTRLSANEISLHGTLTLTLTLQHPENYSVDLRRLRGNLLRQHGRQPFPFRLLDEEVKQLPNETEITYLLEPVRTGNFQLTLWEVGFLPNNQGKIVEMLTDLIPVEVTLPPKVKKEPQPAPPLALTKEFPVEISRENQIAMQNESELPEQNRRALTAREIPWEKLLGLFAFFGILYWAKNLPQAKPPKKKKELPQIQKEAVRQLAAVALPKTDEVEAFYVSLTAIMRRFYEEAYNIHAPSQTTEEFLHETVEKELWDSATQEQVREFLRRADRVKFAGETATTQECEAALASAKKSILQ